MAKYLVTTIKSKIKEIDPDVVFGPCYNDAGAFSRRVKIYVGTKEKDRTRGIHNANMLNAACLVAVSSWFRENGQPLASTKIEVYPSQMIGVTSSVCIIIRIQTKDTSKDALPPAHFTRGEAGLVAKAIYFLQDEDFELADQVLHKLGLTDEELVTIREKHGV